MMNKKGDGMSLNLVVVAAIALVVLIVLLAIFGGKMRQGTQGQEKAIDDFNTNLCSQRTDLTDPRCYNIGEGSCTKERAEENTGYIDCPAKSGCCLSS